MKADAVIMNNIAMKVLKNNETETRRVIKKKTEITVSYNKQTVWVESIEIMKHLRIHLLQGSLQGYTLVFEVINL